MRERRPLVVEPPLPLSWVVAPYWPASEPPMPPTLKYLLSSTKMATGGSIAMTATAITEPQSVTFCWKNDCRPRGRVKAIAERRNTMATR